MTTPPPGGSSSAGTPSLAAGTVLGTNAFQSAVDQFKTAVDAFKQAADAIKQGATRSGSAPGYGGATAGSGGAGGQATMGSSASAQAQLRAPAALRTATSNLTTQSRGSSNLHQFAYGAFGGNLINRPTAPGPGAGPLSRGRLAQVGGQLVRAGAQVVGSMATSYMGSQADYSTSLDAYTRQAALWNPTNGLSGGRLAAAYGGTVQQYGGQYWASGPSDLFGAALTINQQAYQRNYGTMMTAASSMAMVNPGMTMQDMARLQGTFGTAQAFYTSQMYGLATPRFAGGGQRTPMDTMNSLANKVNANIGGFQNLSQTGFKAEMAQGGTLATSLATFGAQIGLSGQQQQAIGNYWAAENKLTSPSGSGLAKMTMSQAQNLLNTASTSPDSSAGQAALKTLTQYGFGDTLSAAKNLMQGKQANGYLSDSADYLDAAKSSANTLTDIYGLLSKVLGPFAGIAGAYQQGGAAGVAGYALGGADKVDTSKNPSILGQVMNGISAVGQAPAKLYEPLINQIFGPPKQSAKGKGAQGSSTSGPGQSSGPASSVGSGPVSGSASAALSFAEQQLGKPYVYGSNGPDSWDCSSFVQAAWKAGGVSLPRTSEEQSTVGALLGSVADAQPGDLIFYGSPGNAGHVGMVTGPDTVVEAPHTGTVVKYEKISQDPSWKFARRVAAGGQPVTSNLLGGGVPGNAQTTQGGDSVGAGFTALDGHAEIDALAAALAGGGAWSGSAGDSPPAQNATAANSPGDPAGASSGDYDWGAITGKNQTIPAPPASIKDAIAAAMALTGVSGADWARGLTTIAFRESGYNPNSENDWDSNAAAGDPSRGLFQTIKSTFEANRVSSLPDDIFNPEADAAAAINYIKKRYNGIQNVQQANPDLPPKGYSAGAWDVPTTQTAQLHPGEMVLPQGAAQSMRQALMGSTLGTKPTSGAVTINFSPGSITVQMPSTSADGAKAAAKSFVDFVSADDRIKALMGGR
ncbi:NlpC/P60 family protein [Kitasatospora sp. NPDC052896]|uniref:NlpC/P60 family protein n=1 Tax=Kitasatospora sp. NPDC052896 TaxID=3364061 RepID=UPI0037C5F478